MKKILILSLFISITNIHAMDHDVPEDAAHNTPPARDNASNSCDFDTEVRRMAINLAQSQLEIAKLRTKAIALESIVRASVPDHKEFALLSKLNFKPDERLKTVQLALTDEGLKKLGFSQEQRKIMLESFDAITDSVHEEATLKQAVQEMALMIARHESNSGWCDLL